MQKCKVELRLFVSYDCVDASCSVKTDMQMESWKTKSAGSWLIGIYIFMSGVGLCMGGIQLKYVVLRKIRIFQNKCIFLAQGWNPQYK